MRVRLASTFPTTGWPPAESKSTAFGLTSSACAISLSLVVPVRCSSSCGPSASTNVRSRCLSKSTRADEPGSGRVSPARSRPSSDALCARTSELPRWLLASLASAEVDALGTVTCSKPICAVPRSRLRGLDQSDLGEQRLVRDLEHDRIRFGLERVRVPARHRDHVADREALVRAAVDPHARLAADDGVEMI